MKLTLVERPLVPPSASPYRLLDERGQEVAWANAFLDAQRIRQLSLRSLRAYAYDLLHFARWFQDPPRPLSQISQSTLLDYVRHQLDQQPQPTPQTVNHRLLVVHCLYRFHYGQEIPPGQSHFQRTYFTRSPLGYGRPRPRVAVGLRLRQPRRVIVPLSADEVAPFWGSFRTFRDLALVGRMDSQWPLPPIGFRDPDSSRRLRSICSTMDSPMEIAQPRLHVFSILLPRHPVHSRRRLFLQAVIARPEQVNAYVVQQSCELELPVLPCCFAHTLQPTWPGFPARSPVQVRLPRVLLGLCPSLRNLRQRFFAFVRLLRRYYGAVRLPIAVHKGRAAHRVLPPAHRVTWWATTGSPGSRA